jgi:hypothetical protein
MPLCSGDRPAPYEILAGNAEPISKCGARVVFLQTRAA